MSAFFGQNKINTVRLLIEDLLKKLCIIKENIEILDVSKPGEHFLSYIYKVKVEGHSNEKDDHLKLFVKVAPPQKVFRSLFPLESAYEREIYIYNKILPEFIKIQKEKGIQPIFKPFPKYYKSSMGNKCEALIMDDLSEQGFVNVDYKVSVTYEQALLIMKEFGKFHALSYAMRDQKPDLFKALGQNCEDSFFNGSFFKQLPVALKNLTNKIICTYDYQKHPDAIDLLNRFILILDKDLHPILRSEKSGKYAVINHGDGEIRNMLFKYVDSADKKILSEVRFVDWQLSRFASPAFDILFFIFVCTDKKLRDKYYTNLINEYYNSLKTFLRHLGSDSEKLIPFEVLLKHIQEFSVFGLYAAIWLLSANCKEVENVPDLYNCTDIEEVKKFVSFEPNDLFFIRVKEVIEDFLKYKYELIL